MTPLPQDSTSLRLFAGKRESRLAAAANVLGKLEKKQALGARYGPPENNPGAVAKVCPCYAHERPSISTIVARGARHSGSRPRANEAEGGVTPEIRLRMDQERPAHDETHPNARSPRAECVPLYPPVRLRQP